MTDLVERLRHHSPVSYSLLMREAADEIEALQAALKVHAGYAAEVEKQRDEIERLRRFIEQLEFIIADMARRRDEP